MPSRSIFRPLQQQVSVSDSEKPAPPEPPPSPHPPAPVMDDEAPLARVPSQPTIVPGPVLAINLADLAAAISPHYSVAELREALLKASRPVDSQKSANASQNLSSDLQGVTPISSADIEASPGQSAGGLSEQAREKTLSVVVDKNKPVLHVTSGSPTSDPLAIPGRMGSSLQECFAARTLPLSEAERELGSEDKLMRSFPARSYGEPSFSGLGTSHLEPGSLQASLGHWADSLTAVPGSLVESYHRHEADGMYDEENPSDTAALLSRDRTGYGSLSTSVTESRQHAIIQREKEEVIVSLPTDTAEVILHDPKSTAILLPMPEKPVEDASENGLHHHLVVVPRDAPSESSKEVDAHEHHLRLMQIESELHVHEASGKDADSGTQDYSLNVTYSVSWLGYAILAVAILSVASQGTAVRWLPSVAGTVTACWLMQAQALLMLPFCVAELAAMPAKERQSLLTDWSLIRLIIAASVAQVAWASGFFVASDYTSLFRAWQLNNIHSVLIVVLAVITGRVVSRGEATGMSLALLGVLVMQIPVFFGRGLVPFFGDVVAVASSVGAIIFLELCSRLRERIPLFVMMVPVSICNAVLFSLAACLGQGGDFSMTDNGAFGWLASNRIFFGLYLGGVVGMLGTVSCIAALSHLPSVVVGVAQTLMPPVGTSAAAMLGMAEAPTGFTLVGGAVLVAGVLTIAQATSKREVVVDLNQHVSAVAA